MPETPDLPSPSSVDGRFYDLWVDWRDNARATLALEPPGPPELWDFLAGSRAALVAIMGEEEGQAASSALAAGTILREQLTDRMESNGGGRGSGPPSEDDGPE